VMNHLTRLFPGNPDQVEGSDGMIHFYLTRSNVGSAQLEFATNSLFVRDIHSAERRTVTFRPDRYEIIELNNTNNANKCLERTKLAVFASMDLPPLFPYASIRTD